MQNNALAPPASASDDAPVTIVGAGLAGCWLTHELRLRGCPVRLLDEADGAASGASGNAAGIVKPFITREPSRPESFYRAAFAHLLQRLAAADLADACAFTRSGALQLVRKPFTAHPDAECLDPTQAARISGLPLTGSAVHFAQAGWLNPAALCAALLRDDRAPPGAGVEHRFGCRVSTLERAAAGWQLTLADGSALSAQRVVLATGAAMARLAPAADLPVTPARGQMTRFACGSVPIARTVVTGSSWAIPDGRALWAGATYDRDDTDATVRTEDEARNRCALRALTGGEPGAVLAQRAGVRATVPDRLPILGPLDDAAPARLSVLGGLGSRGIVTSAYCATLLSDWLCGDARPLAGWYDLLSPARFAARRAPPAPR